MEFSGSLLSPFIGVLRRASRVMHKENKRETAPSAVYILTACSLLLSRTTSRRTSCRELCFSLWYSYDVLGNLHNPTTQKRSSALYRHGPSRKWGSVTSQWRQRSAPPQRLVESGHCNRETDKTPNIINVDAVPSIYRRVAKTGRDVVLIRSLLILPAKMCTFANF